MSEGPQRTLARADIARLSSPYIDHGVKQDRWEITSMDIDGPVVRARLRMTSHFVSPTDPDGFHLTVFSTQEFLSQLANIYLHVFAGHGAKSRELWMRECTIASKVPIRDPEHIDVEMEFQKCTWVQGTLIAIVCCRVFDRHGGLFTAKLSGGMR